MTDLPRDTPAATPGLDGPALGASTPKQSWNTDKLEDAMMDHDDNRMLDPLTAFVTGSVVGALLAVLLIPRRKPSLKKELEKAAKRTRKDFNKSSKRVRGTTGDIIEDGAHVLADIRKELERFVEDTRDSLRGVVNEEMKSIEKGLGKRRSRIFG
jgi:gas vesicle protein